MVLRGIATQIFLIPIHKWNLAVIPILLSVPEKYREIQSNRNNFMKALLFKAAVLGACSSVWGLAGAADSMMSFIPHAKPGECYARVMIPAKFRTESSTVVIKEATESLKIVPATYKWAEEQVQVSPATADLQVIPATYGTETDTIELSPASSMWVSGSQYSTVEASQGLLALASAGGAAIESAVGGQCFHELYQQAVYEDVTERVLVSEASETVKVIPAKYEWVEQKEVVASASRKMIEVPAVYGKVTERIKVEDAKVIWKKGRGSIEKIDNATGDIMCLVEVPAVYKTVEKTVMKSAPSSKFIQEPTRYDTVRVRKLIEPAREVRTAIPARYREITKRVKTADGRHFWQSTNVSSSSDYRKTGNMICKRDTPAKTTTLSRTVVLTPATVKKVEVPAKFQSKRIRRLVSEATESRIAIPAVTREISRKIQISDSKLEWVPVLCETNTSQATIKRLQSALSDSGYDIGVISGELSAPTVRAIENYQRDHGMATGGLTIDLLKKLGVNPG